MHESWPRLMLLSQCLQQCRSAFIPGTILWHFAWAQMPMPAEPCKVPQKNARDKNLVYKRHVYNAGIFVGML